MINHAIASRLNLTEGIIEGGSSTHRRLRDLAGIFADRCAYEETLQAGNPLVYTVSSIEIPSGDGQLHYGLGRLMPGRIGSEYYLTKGHFHAWREAAEVYIGLRGQGMMLLQDEQGASKLLPLGADEIVYVPGHTAHRTINTGTVPLIYLGVYPSAAGHDYAQIAQQNFQKIVLERDGKPVVLDRSDMNL